MAVKFKDYRLGDVCQRLSSGKSITSKDIHEKGEFPVFGGNGLRGYSNISNFEGDCALIGRQGAQCGNVHYFVGKGYITEHAIVAVASKDNNTRYLSYVLSSMNLGRLSGQSAQPGLSVGTLAKQIISLPPKAYQERVVSIISPLEDKILINREINDNLEKQLELMYRKLKMNSECSESATIDSFCSIFTGKKNANQFDADGMYKFFTCGDTPLRINSFIHDGAAIIISGNGSYTGRTTFYKGRFDLYQRTYACTPLENVNPDFIYGLYPIIKHELQRRINGGTHGSSIPYIVFNDIAKFEFKYNREFFPEYSLQCKNLILTMLNSQKEIDALQSLRDYLLPLLMSGQISIGG